MSHSTTPSQYKNNTKKLKHENDTKQVCRGINKAEMNRALQWYESRVGTFLFISVPARGADGEISGAPGLPALADTAELIHNCPETGRGL